MNYGKLLILGALIGALLFGGSLVFPKWAWPTSRTHDQILALQLENEILKAQLLQQQLGVTQSHQQYTVKVYSVYPFNNQSSVTIAAGSLQDLQEGLPVTIGGNILIGYVEKVFDNQSLVKTVFDDWQVSVRIGAAGIDALLVGGRTPQLTLIGSQKLIQSGDRVYSAGKDFPYGLTIGTVGEVKNSANNLFKEAPLEVPYRLNELSEVAVITK